MPLGKVYSEQWMKAAGLIPILSLIHNNHLVCSLTPKEIWGDFYFWNL